MMPAQPDQTAATLPQQDTPSILTSEMKAAIDAAVAEASARYETQLAEQKSHFEQQLAAMSAAAVPSPVTEHAAGVGLNVYPTWSQYDQELSRAGYHPDQELAET